MVKKVNQRLCLDVDGDSEPTARVCIRGEGRGQTEDGRFDQWNADGFVFVAVVHDECTDGVELDAHGYRREREWRGCRCGFGVLLCQSVRPSRLSVWRPGSVVQQTEKFPQKLQPPGGYRDGHVAHHQVQGDTRGPVTLIGRGG